MDRNFPYRIWARTQAAEEAKVKEKTMQKVRVVRTCRRCRHRFFMNAWIKPEDIPSAEIVCDFCTHTWRGRLSLNERDQSWK